ncbi:PAS domain-containing sensor histidine kinase [Undibacterium sp.]|jgi:two-component system sensor histidine kinase PilS (NtrC family)|uniref:two-component system sensor histidine kinase NtrB n=1 Tax=Undibacterium sp. TaxID=1914977 RepID=UPI002BD8FB84|nr:PAS domain-containing sensor histidine kinase [Undibacterium sp.]HTD05961.1 PAS domain-containing sensor histidine kinase [Undibacterium sp.]
MPVSPSFRSNSHTFGRSLQTLNVSRVVVALVLLGYLGLKSVHLFWSPENVLFRETCIVYLLLAIAFVLLKIYWPQRFMLQLAAQTAVDITIISILYVGTSGAKNGLAILYLFPLAGAGVLAPLIWALFFTSIVALFLLLESAYQVLQLDEGISISQAGLYGAAFFAVVYVLNRLASKLIWQEELAAQRGKELAIQQAINRLVIADMGDGLLVVDQFGRLFEINPAAERMLGGMVSTREIHLKLQDFAGLSPISVALIAWQQKFLAKSDLADSDTALVAVRLFEDRRGGGTTAENPDREAGRRDFVAHLKLRFVTIDNDDIADIDSEQGAYTIIFMQDVSEIENQAQQLKLASMGRLTASIAHEVRNPLSSISYAASLLNEDIPQDAQARRLLKIVDDNVLRLNQLIEDILKLSRKAQTDHEPFLLIPAIQEIVLDLNETRGLATNLIYVDHSVNFTVQFDPLHLREIVMNLLSNAIRYASNSPASIRIWANAGAPDRKELHIQDDGPGITHEVRSHLFEPFYTTSSKGTGLGLYMARELCLNNHALLDYEYRIDEPQMSPQASFLAAPPANTAPTGRFVINFSLAGKP